MQFSVAYFSLCIEQMENNLANTCMHIICMVIYHYGYWGHSNTVHANNEWIALHVVCYKLEKNIAFQEKLCNMIQRKFQKYCIFPSKVNKLTLNALILYFWKLLKEGGKNQNGTCTTLKTNQIKSYLSLDARYGILTLCVLFLCNP